MDNRSRHSIYVLPPLRSPRRRDLRILVLADGNQRAEASGSGYGRGAGNVVGIAEHLAARTDVAVLIACILSPDNVRKRGPAFFAKVHAEFVRLRRAIETGSVLVSAGVRLGIAGDLRALAARGGNAALLAEAIEAAVRATSSIAAPKLELLFGVSYSPDVAVDLDVDVILRTGMEEERALRLSGLSSHPGILNVATTKLWPEVTEGDMDLVIERAKARTDPVLAAGHPRGLVTDLFVELSRRELCAAVSVTIPTAAPQSILEAIEGARGGAPRDVDEPGRRFMSMIAPGQATTGLIVPVSPPLGQANVFASGTSAAEIVDGIERALRFAVAHPPLLGADREAGQGAITPAMNDAWSGDIIGFIGLVEQRPGRSVAELIEAVRHPGYFVFDDPRVIADVFSAKLLCWARSQGLLLAGEGALRAALNYVLTAFFIHYDGPRARGAVEADWEKGAALAARAMLAIAAGDDGIFDGRFEGDASKAVWSHRLAASARFLQDMMSDELVDPPAVNGSPLLSAIAKEWRTILAEHRGLSHPEVLEGWRMAVLGLYRASLDEYDDALVDNALVDGLDAAEAEDAAAEIEDRYAAVAPKVIGDRIRELAGGPGDEARSELRLLLYLHDTATSIAAGLLFRTVALRVPADEVTTAMARALDATATLVDWAFRLDNDISSSVGWSDGERDAKRGACAVLVPRGLTGAEKDAAVERSLALCRAVSAWIRDALSTSLAELHRLWPAMAIAVRRGVFVGRRVYQVGHYERLNRQQMTQIVEELDAREARPLVAQAG